MTSTIISTGPQYTFGAITNRMTANMISGNTLIERLNDAIATASSNYQGTPGTQFEISGTGNPNQYNLFGVLASDTPGEQGQAYAYAVGRLHELWQAFWADAAPYVEQLDNGTTGI